MHNPVLLELPTVNNNKSNWPWTQEKPHLPATMPNGSSWPKMSIVTPSFNQAQFLEETIRSVLLQGYPNLEYFIMDGGSSDGSIEVIKKYAPWLAGWVSQKDGGQPHAINKGLKSATGEIFAWINSDDTYAEGAFYEVAKTFVEQDTLWVAGTVNRIKANGEIDEIIGKPLERIESWFVSSIYAQPGVFWRRELWEKTGGVNEDLHFVFDYDLWLKFIQHQQFAFWIDQHLANFRIHSESKTSLRQLKFIQEREIIYKNYPFKPHSVAQFFYVWRKRREYKARIYYRLPKGSMNFAKKNFIVLINAPWLFFKKLFKNFHHINSVE